MSCILGLIKEFYQKELVESPPAGTGEIKIGLFITPILFLLGRVALKLSTVNCQLSTVELAFESLTSMIIYKSQINVKNFSLGKSLL